LQDDHDHEDREKLAADQGHILKRGIEAALPADCDLAHVGCAGSVLAADREALGQAGDEQQDRSRDADAGVGGQAGDHERAAAHHHDRNEHRGAPAVLVGDPAEHIAADRAHQEPSGKDTGRVQKLRCLIAGGKEGRGGRNFRSRIGRWRKSS
jgi:hypothetical protein